MDFARLKKTIGFYGRFLVSFSALGYRARAMVWQRLRADFTGQTWVVTGATGGIGRAVVEGATSRGATVLALGRSHQKLDALALQCWPELPNTFGWAYLALSRLADEGFAVAMEGDVDGAVTCLIANHLGIGHDSHSRRLFQVDGERLFQRVVERGVAGAVVEVGEHHARRLHRRARPAREQFV